jgi:hypothetical protein
VTFCSTVDFINVLEECGAIFWVEDNAECGRNGTDTERGTAGIADQITWCHITKDLNLHSQCCGTLKFHFLVSVSYC